MPIVYLLDWHDYTQKIAYSGSITELFFYDSPGGRPLNFEYRTFSFNFVPLLALILAVPDVRPKLRLKILLIGMALIFPFHVFRLVLLMLNYYGQHMQTSEGPAYPFLYRKGLYYADLIIIRLDGYLTALTIWFGLMFYYKWQYKYFKKASAA